NANTAAAPKTSANAFSAVANAAKIAKTSTAANTSANTTQPAAATAAASAATAAAKFDDSWKKALNDGFVPNTVAQPKNVSVNTAFLSQPETKPAAGGDLEIAIQRDPSVHDGRFANNGWLQEVPRSLNKVTWSNVALISPRTADRLGV